ncbi:hypothetical protein NBRC116187_09030 [Halopseudomonas sabulinigri]|uniref:Secreted protein n=1 Tax=Halopseudomonas sabulinigri TaxID=472181 RepID=A0ABP9ZM40_9GAMM
MEGGLASQRQVTVSTCLLTIADAGLIAICLWSNTVHSTFRFNRLKIARPSATLLSAKPVILPKGMRQQPEALMQVPYQRPE